MGENGRPRLYIPGQEPRPLKLRSSCHPDANFSVVRQGERVFVKCAAPGCKDAGLHFDVADEGDAAELKRLQQLERDALAFKGAVAYELGMVGDDGTAVLEALRARLGAGDVQVKLMKLCEDLEAVHTGCSYGIEIWIDKKGAQKVIVQYSSEETDHLDDPVREHCNVEQAPEPAEGKTWRSVVSLDLGELVDAAIAKAREGLD